MAFTQPEKFNILFYLGYSGFEDDGPAMRAINSLDTREASMGPIVRQLLQKLADVDADIHKARPLTMAIEDGSIKLRAHYTIATLQKLGRQYVVRLARFTKIMIGGDVFGTGGSERSTEFYSGDPSERRIDAEYGVPTVSENRGIND